MRGEIYGWAMPEHRDLIEKKFSRHLKAITLGLLVLALVWTPFPLGGAVKWAPSVQQALIAGCWILFAWSLSGLKEFWALLRPILPSALLCCSVLVWVFCQMQPWVPSSWIHPIWMMARDIANIPAQGTVSINSWHTEAALLQLASLLVAFWVAYGLSRNVDQAQFILTSVTVICAGYALYALVLKFLNSQQTEVLYGLRTEWDRPSGPFMLHNSFATYCALGAIASAGNFFQRAQRYIVVGRGTGSLVASYVRYLTGPGLLAGAALLLTVTGVVASGSRGGFSALAAGFLTLFLIAVFISRGGSRLSSLLGAVVGLACLLIPLLLGADTLAQRMDILMDTQRADVVRTELWSAATRMIEDSPWLGFGLGTFSDAYPLYARSILPFVMDKAHSDYLEFAAGVGLPAAFAWWLGLLLLIGRLLLGAAQRRRNRVYLSVAVASSAAIAVHSCVDFSLQLPAVAFLYAVLLGVGVSQAMPTRVRALT